MIEHPAFPVEEWSVREIGCNLDTLAQSESIFALSNGHIGLRGNLDEGEPHGLPVTYLNSFYELRPLPSAEGGYQGRVAAGVPSPGSHTLRGHQGGSGRAPGEGPNRRTNGGRLGRKKKAGRRLIL